MGPGAEDRAVRHARLGAPRDGDAGAAAGAGVGAQDAVVARLHLQPERVPGGNLRGEKPHSLRQGEPARRRAARRWDKDHAREEAGGKREESAESVGTKRTTR